MYVALGGFVGNVVVVVVVVVVLLLLGSFFFFLSFSQKVKIVFCDAKKAWGFENSPKLVENPNMGWYDRL